MHNSLHNINRYIIRAGIQSLGYLCNNFKRNGSVYFIAVWAFLFVQQQKKYGKKLVPLLQSCKIATIF